MRLAMKCLSLRRQLGRLRTLRQPLMDGLAQRRRANEDAIQNQPPQCSGGNDGRGRKPYAWAQRLGNAGWREFAESGQPALVAESGVWGCGAGAGFDDAGASGGRKPYAGPQRLGNAGWREFAESGQPALVAESGV